MNRGTLTVGLIKFSGTTKLKSSIWAKNPSNRNGTKKETRVAWLPMEKSLKRGVRDENRPTAPVVGTGEKSDTYSGRTYGTLGTGCRSWVS